ncbi:putative protein N(5)-glutamine methyltransferase [Isoptericola sp. NPDC057191]|uniref:putative protein N(5)-glutamine methyltransferase n=1 Tax=Isoptericola sp. NPDC057191 TaxID=3346041 RepID=UPI00363CACE0
MTRPAPAPDDPTTAAVVARLRAAGCVFAEDEAALLLEAAGSLAPGQRGTFRPGRQFELPTGTGTAAPIDRRVLDELVERRVAGEPLEHVLGWVAFAGRRWSVGPGVFVPRRRTELMVAAALTLPAPGTVVDLCCGCGAVGGAVLLGLHAAGAAPVLHASDVEPAAVVHARRNLEPLGAVVHEGDLLAAVPAILRGRVDLLLCNAPYVPTAAIATMPPEARDHEPAVALDGGADGLDVLRRVVAAAPAWLAPGGALLFEVGTDQVAGATTLVESHGLSPAVVTDDDPDADDATGGTVLVATRPAP